MGATSANAVIPTITPGSSASVTIRSGALSLAIDPSTPARANISNGSRAVPIGVVRFTATNESVILNRIGFTLVTGVPQNIERLIITDGATTVGTANLIGRNGTSTLAIPVTIPLTVGKVLTVKADFARAGASLPGVIGDRIIVGVTSGINTQGVGLSSGSTLNATGSATFSEFIIN